MNMNLMNEYILNVLTDYATSNRREANSLRDDDPRKAVFLNAAGKAEAMIQRMNRGEGLDLSAPRDPAIEGSMYEITQIEADVESKDAVTKLYNMLRDFIDKIHQMEEENQNEVVQAPEFNDYRVTNDQLQYLAGLGNWKASKEWDMDDLTSPGVWHSDELKAQVRDGIHALEEASKKVWGGSTQYKEFQEALKSLQTAINEQGDRNLDTLYEDAMKKARAYLTYKAGDATISRKGRTRVNTVNRILSDMMSWSTQLYGNRKIYKMRKAASETQVWNVGVKSELDLVLLKTQMHTEQLVNEKREIYTQAEKESDAKEEEVNRDTGLLAYTAYFYMEFDTVNGYPLPDEAKLEEELNKISQLSTDNGIAYYNSISTAMKDYYDVLKNPGQDLTKAYSSMYKAYYDYQFDNSDLHGVDEQFPKNTRSIDDYKSKIKEMWVCLNAYTRLTRLDLTYYGNPGQTPNIIRNTYRKWEADQSIEKELETVSGKLNAQQRNQLETYRNNLLKAKEERMKEWKWYLRYYAQRPWKDALAIIEKSEKKLSLIGEWEKKKEIEQKFEEVRNEFTRLDEAEEYDVLTSKTHRKNGESAKYDLVELNKTIENKALMTVKAKNDAEELLRRQEQQKKWDKITDENKELKIQLKELEENNGKLKNEQDNIILVQAQTLKQIKELDKLKQEQGNWEIAGKEVVDKLQEENAKLKKENQAVNEVYNKLIEEHAEENRIAQKQIDDLDARNKRLIDGVSSRDAKLKNMYSARANMVVTVLKNTKNYLTEEYKIALDAYYEDLNHEGIDDVYKSEIRGQGLGDYFSEAMDAMRKLTLANIKYIDTVKDREYKITPQEGVGILYCLYHKYVNKSIANNCLTGDVLPEAAFKDTYGDNVTGLADVLAQKPQFCKEFLNSPQMQKTFFIGLARNHYAGYENIKADLHMGTDSDLKQVYLNEEAVLKQYDLKQAKKVKQVEEKKKDAVKAPGGMGK